MLATLLALPAHAGDRMILLVLALGLDAAIGDPPSLYRVVPHPVAIIGRIIAELDRRLNRERRSQRARFIRGIVAIGLLGGGAILSGLTLEWAAARLQAGWVIELVAVAIMVAQRSLYDHVKAVQKALLRDGLPAARQAVSRIVGRDPDSLDQFSVARAGIESLAENFSDGVVGPVLFYALAGLPGLLLYKAVNTADSMIGHKTERHLAFGWAAARLDDLLNLVPARLSGLLIALAAAFVARGRPDRALRTMWQDAAKHRSPNAGWPEAAMAGALGLALAGPRRYGEIAVNDPWLGDGRARATPEDMARALSVFAVACLLEILALAALALLHLR
jgi:adenosylcobinamide-phosphate synthase